MVGILFPLASEILFLLRSMDGHSNRLSRANRGLFPRLYSTGTPQSLAAIMITVGALGFFISPVSLPGLG